MIILKSRKPESSGTKKMLDELDAKKRHKAEAARKAAATRRAVSMDRTVIIKKRKCKELERLISSKMKIPITCLVL